MGVEILMERISMKTKLIVLLAFYLLVARASCCLGQTGQEVYPAAPIVSQPASDRLFFPKNVVRGFTEAGYLPSHNEADLGRCASWTGAYGGAAAPCAAFGRYFLGGYAEFQPFARKLGPLPLHRVFLFLEPRAFFGRNIPRFNYSASFAPINFERTVGIIIAVRRNLDVRIWQHQNDWLGRYGHSLGPADLGTSGPYGMYAGISTRWYFGSWGRQH
jgi:hypothetical protein